MNDSATMVLFDTTWRFYAEPVTVKCIGRDFSSFLAIMIIYYVTYLLFNNVSNIQLNGCLDVFKYNMKENITNILFSSCR